jgi:hypothetical protein
MTDQTFQSFGRSPWRIVGLFPRNHTQELLEQFGIMAIGDARKQIERLRRCRLQAEHLHDIQVVGPRRFSGRGGAILGINRKWGGKIVGNRPERIGSRPGEERRPADLSIFDRLNQCQGCLVLQSGKLGAELPVETKEWASFFWSQATGRKHCHHSD